MATEIETPYFDFTLNDRANVLNCKAIMYPTSFEILISSTTAANLTLNDDWRWIPVGSKILPDELIREIGNKIESRYM